MLNLRFKIAILITALGIGVRPNSVHAYYGTGDRIDEEILRAARQADGDAGALSRFAVKRGLRVRGGDRPSALVVIETATMAAGERLALERVGAKIEMTVDASTLAWVPLNRLDDLGKLPRVLRVRRPIPANWVAITEGVSLTGASLMHDQLGARGAGVKIGVIDEFKGYTAKLGGELPAASMVHFRSFVAGGGEGDSSHGVRVSEIISDMAPEAELFLAAIADDVGFRRAVDWFIASGVHVINHSGGFGLFGDLRGAGPLHSKVAEATAAGALYVAAAGNSGRSHWAGSFTDTDGNGQHEFLPGIERLPFTVPTNDFLMVRVDLSWDDWRPNPADPRPTTDYDICLYDEADTRLACADAPQSGLAGQVPYEGLMFTVPSTGLYFVGVELFAGAPGLAMELILVPDFDLGGFAVPESSLIVPADHRNAFTVGATSVGDVIRPYSSRGPTNDGRVKPDVTAPDGVSTSFGAFFGTSAAAPHVSGAAAILKSTEPGLGPSALASRLRSFAVQVAGDTTPGADNVYGSGRLNANFARLTPPTATPRPPVARPPSSSSSGGCRLVDPDRAQPGGGLLLFLTVLLVWAAGYRRG